MPVVRIDRDACISCGVCAALCADVFMLDPTDSKSAVIERFRVGNDMAKGEIPADLLDCAKTAAENCPVQAIRIE
ncbi:MAG: ferredoxin [Crenarchaeota archaeon]|nr:ferredoxin [Thermoproteota archaeon]MCR8471057.1 ferredoxin [Thermoproteota archaeon]MCR8472218.1 ferredoxin [Thermoproteota archaeon]MCR8473607.1 ferredoxin [Thermoproteota archaeon]MCR8488807.1 ferredoxin [Thermoproteota archaeon]